MSQSASLKDILQKRKLANEASGGSTAKAEKVKARAAAIKELFDEIDGWLKPSVEAAIATIDRQPYVHEDDRLGNLTEESLVIKVGSEEVLFAPRGGSIAGASARVDMKVGDRTIPLVCLPDRGWFLLVRAAVTRTDPLTEDSFKTALTELLDG